MLSRLRALISAASASKRPPGVDVSGYQGPPADWRPGAGSFSWAAVKITELQPGEIRYVNPDAAADWKWLGDHGKGRIGYFFGHPDVSAKDTVSFFVREIRKLGLDARDAVALDLEVTNGKTPAEVADWARRVQEDLAGQVNRVPLLYTFLSFAQDGNCAGLGHYPLWIADPSRRAGHPRVPKPWSRWAIHQYSITGQIDRDTANYTSQTEMFAHLGKPEEPDMRKLGGTIVGALASVRWPDGVTVVAGLGQDGFIQAARWHNGSWSGWKNVSTGKALGAPALIIIGREGGHLYYTDDSGEVIELSTEDRGDTWS